MIKPRVGEVKNRPQALVGVTVHSPFSAHASRALFSLLALIVRDGAGAACGVAGHVLDRSGHRIDPFRSISGSLGAELDAPAADHDIRRRIPVAQPVLRLVAGSADSHCTSQASECIRRCHCGHLHHLVIRRPDRSASRRDKNGRNRTRCCRKRSISRPTNSPRASRVLIRFCMFPS